MVMQHGISSDSRKMSPEIKRKHTHTERKPESFNTPNSLAKKVDFNPVPPVRRLQMERVVLDVWVDRQRSLADLERQS